MKTNVFYSKLSSAQLQESLEKQFGVRINLNKYDREQLEDIRNKLRTRIFQQEGSAGINDLLTNETYQKDKAMLELLNTRIKEMLGEQMKQLRDKMDQLTEAKKVKGDSNLANNAKPYDKVTQGDVIAGRLGKDEKGGKKADKAGKPFQETAKKMCAKCKKSANMCKCAVEEQAGKPFQEAVKKMCAKCKKPAASCKCAVEEQAGKPFQEAVKKMCAKCKKSANMCKCAVEEGFDDMEKANATRHAAEKNAKGTDKFDKKKTTTGIVYTKKATKDQPEPEPEDKKSKKVKESVFKQNVKFVNESIEFFLNEDEEAKAKTITAAGDIVNDFTSWMQRVGQYQTKAIIELADEIRSEFGAAEAQTFKQTVAPALSVTLKTLTQQREAISNAVATLAGEPGAEESMGMDPDMGAEDPGMDLSAPDEMNTEPMGDEFGASDAAAGGAETSGREMRESRAQTRAKKLAESHSIMSKLAR